MNVRGTQQGSSLRIPAPAPIASWLAVRFAIVFVVMVVCNSVSLTRNSNKKVLVGGKRCAM